MDKKGTKNCDPGWNDPPLFSYDLQNAMLKAAKPRTFLNKRVAFPLNEASSPSTSLNHVDPTTPPSNCNVSNLPPPQSVLISHKGPDLAQETVSSSMSVNASKALETVTSTFNKFLNEKLENDIKEKLEIKRRLDIMEQMWNDDKFSEDIKLKLLELADALRSGAIDKADDLQKSLMVDHATVCSPWMSGIRHLIHLRSTSS